MDPLVGPPIASGVDVCPDALPPGLTFAGGLSTWMWTACGWPGVIFARRVASMRLRSSFRVATYTTADAITIAAATAPAARRTTRRRKLIASPL
jgi:hypothetical protein